jgi:hypothetical protein
MSSVASAADSATSTLNTSTTVHLLAFNSVILSIVIGLIIYIAYKQPDFNPKTEEKGTFAVMFLGGCVLLALLICTLTGLGYLVQSEQTKYDQNTRASKLNTAYILELVAFIVIITPFLIAGSTPFIR